MSDRYAAQLAQYAKLLEPGELQQIEQLLRTGKFGAAQTNGLITNAGYGDLGVGYRHLPAGTMDRALGTPVTDTPGIAQSRQNLLDFIGRNSQTSAAPVTPQAGPPNLGKINQAAQNGQVLAGMSADDLQILDDVTKGRPAPAAPAPKPSAPVSQVIPKAKPIMSATQPAPAAPQPRPQLTSTPSGSTKVSATPTPRGTVASTPVRIPAPATPMSQLNNAPGATRLAGEVVEESPGMVKYIQDVLSGGADKAKQIPGGIDKGKAGAFKYLRGKAIPLAGAGGVLSVLSAAGELADEDDPFARNAAQAAGNLAGGWSGAAAGAAGGAAIGSVVPIIGTGIGALAGGIIGGWGGTELGSNIAGGIYDAVTGESEADRREQQLIKDANLKNRLQLQQAATARQIMASDLEARLPYMKDAMAIKRQDDMARTERELRVQNDYNYANALNQAMLSAQNQRGLQELALTQFMMG